MTGHWQKEIPKKNGRYWAATQGGETAGPLAVVYSDDGTLLMAGTTIGTGKWSNKTGWGGWWWSEPIEEPPAPPAWET